MMKELFQKRQGRLSNKSTLWQDHSNTTSSFLQAMIKISVITDILIIRFYGYIEDISMNILTLNIGWPKIDQNLQKCIYIYITFRNEIRSIIDILKLFCWRNWYICMYVCICINNNIIIFDNNIICINKKYKFYKCTLIIKWYKINYDKCIIFNI